jgi:hypothetical protein
VDLVCPAFQASIRTKKVKSHAKSVRKIISPTSPHKQHVNSVMVGNQQSSVVLGVFRVHLEKQERHVRRAKLVSFDQQKMNKMKIQIRQSVCLVRLDGILILPVPNVRCAVQVLLVMVANHEIEQSTVVEKTPPNIV